MSLEREAEIEIFATGISVDIALGDFRVPKCGRRRDRFAGQECYSPFGGDEYPAWKKQFTPRVPPLAPVIVPHIVRHRDMPVARRDANKSFILFGSQHRVNRPAGDKVFHFA